MRGALGAVYEFLWANPYQPGLSYFQVPLMFHDAFTGHVFARTSWDEDATWLGYFDGHLQLFQDGQVESLRPGAAIKPVHIGDALLLSADEGRLPVPRQRRSGVRAESGAARGLRRRSGRSGTVGSAKPTRAERWCSRSRKAPTPA